MRRKAALVLVLLSLLSLSCSTTPTPVSHTRDMFAAISRHDVSGTLKFFAGNSALVLPGGVSADAPDHLRQFLEWDSTLAVEMKFADATVHGDTVVLGEVSETGEWFRMLGVPTAKHQAGGRVVFKDGLIVRAELSEYDAASRQAMADSVNRFGTWLHAAHPDLSPEEMRARLFQYSVGSAHAWMTYLEEWRHQAPPVTR
jgi:hypothetical protein